MRPERGARLYFTLKLSLTQVYITCYVKAVPVVLTVSSQNRACSLIENRYSNDAAVLESVSSPHTSVRNYGIKLYLLSAISKCSPLLRCNDLTNSNK